MVSAPSPAVKPPANVAQPPQLQSPPPKVQVPLLSGQPSSMQVPSQVSAAALAQATGFQYNPQLAHLEPAHRGRLNEPAELATGAVAAGVFSPTSGRTPLPALNSPPTPGAGGLGLTSSLSSSTLAHPISVHAEAIKQMRASLDQSLRLFNEVKQQQQALLHASQMSRLAQLASGGAPSSATSSLANGAGDATLSASTAELEVDSVAKLYEEQLVHMYHSLERALPLSVTRSFVSDTRSLADRADSKGDTRAVADRADSKADTRAVGDRADSKAGDSDPKSSSPSLLASSSPAPLSSPATLNSTLPADFTRSLEPLADMLLQIVKKKLDEAKK